MNNFLLTFTISILFGIGTFLILRRDMIKVIIGLSVLSHAVNLLIVSAGVFENGKVPIITGSGHGGEVTSTIITTILQKGYLPH